MSVAVDAVSEEDINQIVGFRLGQEEYGVDVMHVQEIILIGQITQIPNVPEYVCGLINLRGDVIPIIDLCERFSLAQDGRTEDARIIVLNVKEKAIGIIVDAVEEVRRMRSEQIETMTTGVSGIGQQYVRGLVKFEDRLLILLNVERIADMDEAVATASAGAGTQ